MELQVLIRQQSYDAATKIMDAAAMKPGQIFVVGCSTSEVVGQRIGTHSTPDIANAIFDGIHQAAKEHGVFLAAQCCEHLNRAIIIEGNAAEKFGYEPVNVVPQPKAGGSFATAAWNGFLEPVAVEHIRAHAGMDIGDTLIGMHLKDVAVPLRIEGLIIGDAHITCARTRPKFIGGIRACYDERKL